MIHWHHSMLFATVCQFNMKLLIYFTILILFVCLDFCYNACNWIILTNSNLCHYAIKRIFINNNVTIHHRDKNMRALKT